MFVCANDNTFELAGRWEEKNPKCKQTKWNEFVFMEN